MAKFFTNFSTHLIWLKLPHGTSSFTSSVKFIPAVFLIPNMLSLYSCDSIVEDHEEDEGAVEDGEGDEELVEGIAHLLGGQDHTIVYKITFFRFSKMLKQSFLDNNVHLCTKLFLSMLQRR